MRLPLKTISMQFILFIAISSLFLSPVSAKDDLGYQLITASENGDTNEVKQLLKQKGIDVNVKSAFEETALILASTNGHDGVVKLLLEHKDIKVNAKDRYEETALILASNLKSSKFSTRFLDLNKESLNISTLQDFFCLLLLQNHDTK